MNTAVIGIAVASIVAAGLVVSSPSRGPGPVYYQATTVVDERPALEEITVSVEFNETPLAEVLSYFGKLLESDVIVYWSVLEECGISRDAPVTLVLEHKRPVSGVLDLVAQSAAQWEWPATDWRYGDDLLEFSTREYFDRREIRLATFEVGEILTSLEEQHALDREASIETICDLIREYVEPEAWNANGGNLAQLTVVGTQIFVRAPARHLAEIEWILAQLSDGADVEASAAGR